MFNFFKHKGLAIGLDISGVSFRAVQLAEGLQGKKEAQAMTDLSFPKEAFSGDEFKQPEALIRTIKQAINNPSFGKFTTDEVVASIPETKSFVRIIEMPALTPDEAGEAIPWEAEQYVPLPIGQVYLDWLILDSQSGSGNDQGTMKVLLTASPKDYIDTYTQLLKQAGLRPVALEVESQATARSLVSEKDLDSAVLIVDFSARRTSFIIYDQGILQFTSSLPVAGDAFTEAVARAKGVKTEEAEKLKREHGLDKEAGKGIRKALLPVVDKVVDEVRNTIRFYEDNSKDNRIVKRLILTGGAAKLKHLPSYFSEKLKRAEQSADHSLRSVPDLKVGLGSPWVRVLDKGQAPPLSREESLSFVTAIGLALRPIEEEEL